MSNQEEVNSREETKNSIDTNNSFQHRLSISLEDISNIIQSMIDSPQKLCEGYTTLSEEENKINFYKYLLQLVFDSQKEKNYNKKKLSAIAFLIFLKKNYSDKITNEEKLEIVSYLLTNISTDDYYIKNFIAKTLGFLATKEFPNCYESFIKILLNKLKENNEENINDNIIDTILRIFISVLNECDDACAIITGDVLPVIINIFKISKNNQKNREKCLIIISLLLNKLSFTDGNDDSNILSQALDTNNLMENSISLFTSILISNPKMLLEIKKYTIRILDIMVRDMPIYSSKFFSVLIEPTWRLIVLELSLYGNNIVFNKEIEYTDDEEITMELNNYKI